MTGTVLLVAVPAAVVGAFAFALTGVLQQRTTAVVRRRSSLDPRLLWDLVRQPAWSLAIVSNLVGLGLQLVALRFAPLVLVQPVLVTGLLFATVLGARLAHRPPDRVMVGGSLLTVAGMVAFLVAARPVEGVGDVIAGWETAWLAVGLGGLLVVCLLLARRTSGIPRALVLALATGVLYGVTAGLFKVITGEFGGGLGAVLSDWPLWVVVVIGPVAFLLSQNAFQAGGSVSPPLAVTTTLDPLTGIAVGLLWLGESIRDSPGAVVGEVLGLAVMAGGIYALAHRAPAVVGSKP